jgi:hypothetical protein
MLNHDRSSPVRQRRFVADVAVPPAASLLLLLIPLVGFSLAVEPDRPRSSLAQRTVNAGLPGVGNSVTPHHVARRVDAVEVDGGDPSGERRAADHTRRLIWAESAFAFIQRVDCVGRSGADGFRSSPSFAATVRECQDVQKVPRGQVNVYIADPNSRGRLMTVLPDGPVETVALTMATEASSLSSSLAAAAAAAVSVLHDGVVAIDPYPEANFGHLVIVFHVTSGASKAWCDRRDGVLIGKWQSVSLQLDFYRLLSQMDNHRMPNQCDGRRIVRRVCD